MIFFPSDFILQGEELMCTYWLVSCPELLVNKISLKHPPPPPTHFNAKTLKDLEKYNSRRNIVAKLGELIHTFK